MVWPQADGALACNAAAGKILVVVRAESPRDNDMADGLFSSNHAGMVGFLWTLARDRSQSHSFTARNFLLDEGVTAERYGSYENSGGVAGHPDSGTWSAAHEAYMTERIRRPGAGTGPPARVDPKDPDTCPETFRQMEPGSPFHQPDVALALVRVEEVGFIAKLCGVSAGRIGQLVQAVVEGGRGLGSDEYREFADILDDWSLKKDMRPVFAAYWQDVCDLFGKTPAEDTRDWADHLRNRLGLVDLDPLSRTRRGIDVLVFRYPISAVPRLSGGGIPPDTRPLVSPTVLDSGFSPAFCPAPRGGLTGYTVDLGMDGSLPQHEVVHPCMKFTPDHVWRMGTIRRTIQEDALSEARGYHLLALRDIADRDDYADDTDADLLNA